MKNKRCRKTPLAYPLWLTKNGVLVIYEDLDGCLVTEYHKGERKGFRYAQMQNIQEPPIGLP